MNDLKTYFKNNTKRVIHKWHHYFDIYEKYFNKYRGKEVVLLEIGVSKGGSLQMWKDYFGSNAKIYGIDINPKCKAFEEDGIKIFIGSQANKEFLNKVKESIPKIDILIDDGGHRMNEQIVSFEELYDHIKDNGIYVCEDVNTSYMPRYGGGYKKFTFIEYIKNIIDFINADHSAELKANKYTKTINAIHYYETLVIIEKKKKTKSIHTYKGKNETTT